MGGSWGMALAERGMLPDALTRFGIRRLLQRRLETDGTLRPAPGTPDFEQFVAALRNSPLAPVPHLANEQHYEVPSAFYLKVLGPHLKYSSALYEGPTQDLEAAESAMLSIYGERARLQDGMQILELGCGWGSLTLWMASRYPNSRIVAISNSHSQRQFIETCCRERNLTNVRIITCDINEFQPEGQFHRVVSIEMFEHLRNYQKLFQRIRRWLLPDGLLFCHIFCHRERPYLFEERGDDDWMSRHFFSGGIMPSFELFRSFNDDLEIEQIWWVSGRHYQKTSDAWLENITNAKDEVLPLLENAPDGVPAIRQYQRWRIFFMACSELFGFRGGEEWGVGHYVLRPRADTELRQGD